MADPVLPPFPVNLNTLDPNTRGTVEPYLAQRAHRPWNLALAVGTSWRLAKRDPRKLIPAIKAGKLDDLFPERAWASKLTPEAVTHLERRALAHIGQLDSKFDDILLLSEAVDPNARHWRGWLLDLCRRREELECILLVLQAARGLESPVQGALAGLDRRAGTIFPGSWRWEDPPFDWRLIHVRDKLSLLPREHWWTRPVDDYREPPPNPWCVPPF